MKSREIKVHMYFTLLLKSKTTLNTSISFCKADIATSAGDGRKKMSKSRRVFFASKQ